MARLIGAGQYGEGFDEVVVVDVDPGIEDVEHGLFPDSSKRSHRLRPFCSSAVPAVAAVQVVAELGQLAQHQ